MTAESRNSVPATLRSASGEVGGLAYIEVDGKRCSVAIETSGGVWHIDLDRAGAAYIAGVLACAAGVDKELVAVAMENAR